MPSNKPSVNVRLEVDLYERVVQGARAEGRSVGNFIGHRLRQAMAPSSVAHQRWPYETDWVWHQGCRCAACEHEYDRVARSQSGALPGLATGEQQ